MKGKSDWDNIVKKKYQGTNAYIGARFFQNAGIELGYDWQKTRMNTHVFSNGEPWFGNNATNVVSNIRVKLKGFHVDLNGYVPVAESFDIIGSVGLGFWKPTLNIAVSEATPNVMDSIISSKGNGKRKTVARLRVGAQYMLTCILGVRALVGWDNTSRIRLNANALDNTDSINKPLKDQTSASVGAFLTF
jgi:hypothetical protein